VLSLSRAALRLLHRP